MNNHHAEERAPDFRTEKERRKNTHTHTHTRGFYFAWQARDLLLCKGRDVRLWRPSGVPWAPRLCASIWRGRRATCRAARGVMYASGVPLASLDLRASVLLFRVAGARLAALQGA